MSDKQKHIRFTITLSPQIVKKLDEQRRNIPRATFIEFLLHEALKYRSNKTKILNSCSVIEHILDSTHRYPSKSPLRSPATQFLCKDIHGRIEEIKELLE